LNLWLHGGTIGEKIPMVIGGKYELKGLAAEDAEARTYVASELSTGRAVLAHEVLQPDLLPLAARCRPGQGLLIETVRGETASYVVTEAREGFRNLREWLEQAAGEPLPVPKGAGDDRFTRVGAWRVPGSAPSKPVSAEPAPSSASGIFSMPPPTVLPEAEPGPAAAAPPPPPPPPAELGEFTRMFQAARPASPPPTLPATPQGSPSPAAAQPGAFTQMFHSQTPASAPAPSPVTPFPKPAAEEAGEFTRFFQSPLSSKPMEVNPPPSAPAPPPAPVAPPPGEYTRLFQTPAPPSAPVSGRGATQVFVTPSAAPPPETLMQQGPSDFTRIIQASASPSFEARPVEPARPPKAKPGFPVWLIVLIASLAMLAIILVLVLVLRHR
jgi:hypothetical protein